MKSWASPAGKCSTREPQYPASPNILFLLLLPTLNLSVCTAYSSEDDIPALTLPDPVKVKDPCTLEVEARGAGVRGQPRLHSRSVSKTKQEETEKSHVIGHSPAMVAALRLLSFAVCQLESLQARGGASRVPLQQSRRWRMEVTLGSETSVSPPTVKGP